MSRDSVSNNVQVTVCTLEVVDIANDVATMDLLLPGNRRQRIEMGTGDTVVVTIPAEASLEKNKG